MLFVFFLKQELLMMSLFFFQAEDGIRDLYVTGVQTCALPISAIAIERTRIDVVLEQKAKTEAVIEAIEDGLIVLDPVGVVADVNEVACAILEVERDHVRGLRFDDLATTHPH